MPKPTPRDRTDSEAINSLSAILHSVLAECERAGLVRIHERDGKRCAEIQPLWQAGQIAPEPICGVGTPKTTENPSMPAGASPRAVSGDSSPRLSTISGSVSGVLKPRFTREMIEAIYAAYPRKVGRAVAISAIQRALVRISQTEGGGAAAWLLDRVRKYAQYPAGQRGKFTPHCATWMNQARYEDDEGEWRDDGDLEPRRGGPPGGGELKVSDSFVGGDGQWNDRHTPEELDAILNQPDIPPFPFVNTPLTPPTPQENS